MNDTLQMTPKGSLRHFLKIEGLPPAILIDILDRAQAFIAAGQHKAPLLNTLAKKTVANLFFEPSTRTKISFELAAKRLGAEVVDLDIQNSSVYKGESVLDTVYSLQAMFCNCFVIRHSEDNMPEFIARHLEPGVAVINAGSGTFAHPTQAMLDVFTIRQHKTNLSELKIAIVGDIKHSRVARSQVRALKLLGVSNVRLVGPADFMPTDIAEYGAEIFDDMQAGIEDCDVLIMLRLQKERMAETQIPDVKSYHQAYGLTPDKLRLAKPDAIIMHPGPINRGIEIDATLADGPQSVIKQQVSNGIAIRMAILSLLDVA